MISRNITITSGVLLVAQSLQTESGLKGGMDEQVNSKRRTYLRNARRHG